MAVCSGCVYPSGVEAYKRLFIAVFICLKLRRWSSALGQTVSNCTVRKKADTQLEASCSLSGDSTFF